MPSLSGALEARLRALGATVPAGAGTFTERLSSVAFPGPDPTFIFEEWADYAENALFDALRAQPQRAAELVTYPELVWDVRPFTPFTPGTPDHDEWTGTIEAGPLTALCGIAAPTVVFLGYSSGWPNHYFVIAEDPHPEDPTVYTTDHEVYFDEVESPGALSELLATLLTPEEFEASVREALAED